MFEDIPDFSSTPPQKGGSNTKVGDHDTSKSHDPCFIVTYCVEGPIE